MALISVAKTTMIAMVMWLNVGLKFGHTHMNFKTEQSNVKIVPVPVRGEYVCVTKFLWTVLITTSIIRTIMI
ncbi:uncharacterized protein LOC143057215 isoform X2 [Mytilus galloprovincialis]|uniref:uncharacterized protein LOC143057215 isoform X2 n=1 Tax=Mytilus galloprovincialis TaxID=29158 RepID=UPI003F7B669C